MFQKAIGGRLFRQRNLPFNRIQPNFVRQMRNVSANEVTAKMKPMIDKGTTLACSKYGGKLTYKREYLHIKFRRTQVSIIKH